jgi:single-strand DNA-binding protein
LKYTPSGIPVSKITVAVNSHYTDSKGEKKEDATFIPVEIWRKQAETVAEFMKKGRPVLVEGRIRQDKWVSKEGEKRSRLYVVASLVKFLGTAPKADEKLEPENEAEAGNPPAEQDEKDENIPF